MPKNPEAAAQLLSVIDEFVKPGSHIADLFAGMREVNCRGWIVEYLSLLLSDDVLNCEDMPWFGHFASCVREAGGTLRACQSPIPIEPAMKLSHLHESPRTPGSGKGGLVDAARSRPSGKAAEGTAERTEAVKKKLVLQVRPQDYMVAAPDSGCEPDPARSDSSGASTSVPPSSDLGGRVCEPILDSATAVLTPSRLEGLVAQTLPMEGP